MKRAYRRAEPMPAGAGYGVALDGRRVRTPGRNDLVLPNEALAAALAAEWEAQQDEIQHESMPLMQLACTAIDRVSAQRAAIVGQVANYAATDLVCYRAGHPPALAARQQAVWQPLIDWAVLRYDAPLVITTGVLPASQPEPSLHAFAAAVAALDDFALAALHRAAGASGSLVISLAVLEGRLGADDAFAASQLDESHQIAAWGEDSEQAERRRALADDIAAAARFLSLLRQPRG